MIHSAAQNLPYTCFVRPDTRLPFMVMPDAIKALLMLESAPQESLSRQVYNITSFSPTADEIYKIVKSAFPEAQIECCSHSNRQAIVDSWPAQVDDTAACRDWGWMPDYDQDQAFNDYLIPTIRQRYIQHS
jgi:nucleoside-diphosphate-sugar epimerase